MKILPPENAQETANTPENHIRQTETAYLSDAEAAQYRKLRTRAKRCAGISVALWVIALFVPVSFSENPYHSIISEFGSMLYFNNDPKSMIFTLPLLCLTFLGIWRMGRPPKNDMAIRCVIWLGVGIIVIILGWISPESMSIYTVLTAFWLTFWCLLFLGIQRMGEPRQTSFKVDCFIWFVVVIFAHASIFLIALPAGWFWMASDVFVTRAGRLHGKAIELLDTAPNNAVQAAADNGGAETVAEAVHSDSQTHDNPPGNRL